jgi:hypothetical protein
MRFFRNLGTDNYKPTDKEDQKPLSVPSLFSDIVTNETKAHARLSTKQTMNERHTSQWLGYVLSFGDLNKQTSNILLTTKNPGTSTETIASWLH